MPDLLFEIGTEELPPGLIHDITNQILNNILNKLTEENISFKEYKTYNTPRRIAVFISGLPKTQDVKEIEIKGPLKNKAFDNAGNPTQAAIGFCNKHNIKPKDLIFKKQQDVEYVFSKVTIGGKNTKDLFSLILLFALKNTTGEKYMKWGSYEEKFVRPIRWILAVLDKEIIKFSYASLLSDKYTFGHRYLKNKKIEITTPKDYEKTLEESFVIVNQDKRRKKIQQFLKEEADKISGITIINENILNTVTNITEYPESILCEFDSSFLSLPLDVIETVLEKNQKCFVIKKQNEEKLLPYFIVITNGIQEHDQKIKEQIKRGNEKVVKARLNDASFFLKEDLKTPFKYEARIKSLEKISFQKNLNSMYDKVQRITKLAEYIYENLKHKITKEIKPDDITNTAKLCKLDLTTHMVFEFPELQGKIGAIYAKESGSNENVSSGIYEQYDQIPSSLCGLIVGIADKLDNILCLFSQGKIPTGSSDPYALRRQAQSIIDSVFLLRDKTNASLDLANLITIAQELDNKTINKVKEFILDKFKNSLRENYSIEPDIIHSVFSVGEPLRDLATTKNKIQTINEHFLKPSSLDKEFLTAAKRLVRIVEKNINGNVDPLLFKSNYEKELLVVFNEINKKEYKDPQDLISELSNLTKPINIFFDNILVNDPDEKIRQNRQSLLKIGKDLFERICDFNQILERN